ncbi:enoyl-CoA hydratase/isomerase family protein [Sphingopyxis panaciterrae]
MQHYTTLDVRREGAVDWLTLNRPDRLNAINDMMNRELWDYFGRLHDDAACRLVIMRGAGRGFCAGLDLKAFSFADVDLDAPPAADAPPPLTEIVARMRSCPQPIVALVHGAACGGGLALALAADMRIAGRSARMNAAFVKLGLSGCELGTSYYLPRTLGGSLAAELMMTGRFLDGERAYASGLVSALTDDEAMEDYARALAADMLAASPIGLRTTKRVMNAAAHLTDVDAVIALEQEAQIECLRQRPHANGAAA